MDGINPNQGFTRACRTGDLDTLKRLLPAEFSSELTAVSAGNCVLRTLIALNGNADLMKFVINHVDHEYLRSTLEEFLRMRDERGFNRLQSYIPVNDAGFKRLSLEIDSLIAGYAFSAGFTFNIVKHSIDCTVEELTRLIIELLSSFDHKDVKYHLLSTQLWPLFSDKNPETNHWRQLIHVSVIYDNLEAIKLISAKAPTEVEPWPLSLFYSFCFGHHKLAMNLLQSDDLDVGRCKAFESPGLRLNMFDAIAQTAAGAGFPKNIKNKLADLEILSIPRLEDFNAEVENGLTGEGSNEWTVPGFEGSNWRMLDKSVLERVSEIGVDEEFVDKNKIDAHLIENPCCIANLQIGQNMLEYGRGHNCQCRGQE